MKKKFLVCSVIAVAALAAAFAGCNLGGNGGKGDSVTQDHMRFELKDDGTYELSRYEYADFTDREEEDGSVTEGYKGEGETVAVPETVNGKAVTSVAKYAFSGTGVKSVTLPAAITSLPDRIFDSCTLLETVGLPAVTSVGELAFFNCENLETIEFKSGLAEIGARAFEGCAALSTATLPDTVITLGANCFRGCPLGGINATGVQTIGDTAFYECRNITKINLPNVVSIGEQAFRYCDGMTELTIGDKLESISEKPFIDMPLLKKVSISSAVPDEMFMWNETVTEVTLGEGVTAIGNSAFAYCKGVTKIAFPSTLTKIGDSAFAQSAITGTLTIPSSVTSIGDSAFAYCNKITGGLTIPASVKAVGAAAFAGCNKIYSLTFSEGTESLGNYAFRNVGDATFEIVLPSTVKSLGEGCFAGVTAKKIVINESVESVGKDILKGCKVNELTAPANYGHNPSDVHTLTLFGEGDIPALAYKNCENLKTVNLGDGVKSIGENAFKGLQEIDLGGVQSMGENALGDLSALAFTKTENGINYIDKWIISSDFSQGGVTNLDLSGLTGVYENAFKKTDTNDTSALNTLFLVDPEGDSTLKHIGKYAFKGTGVTGVQIPASLTSWDYAFAGCERFNAVAFDAGVEKIPDGAFYGCTALTGVNLSVTHITDIGKSAFEDSGLRNVTLSDGVRRVDSHAFADCDSLLSADLKGAEEIGEYAFNYCKRLGSVKADNVKNIGYYSFSHCESLLSAEFNSLEEIGVDAFYFCTSLSEIGLGNVKIINRYAFQSCSALTDFNLPASVTEIGADALGRAERISYAGTAAQWEAVDKFTMSSGKLGIWTPQNVDGRFTDLVVTFADGSSVTYSLNDD